MVSLYESLLVFLGLIDHLNWVFVPIVVYDIELEIISLIYNFFFDLVTRKIIRYLQNKQESVFTEDFHINF